MSEGVAIEPSKTVANGRDGAGRFAPGNAYARGNPVARQQAAIRREILASVTTGDVSAIVAELVRQAREGNILAAHEVLDRLVGKSTLKVEPDEGVEEPGAGDGLLLEFATFEEIELLQNLQLVLRERARLASAGN